MIVHYQSLYYQIVAAHLNGISQLTSFNSTFNFVMLEEFSNLKKEQND